MSRFLDREAVVDAVSEELGSDTDSHSSSSSSSESEESEDNRFSKRRFVDSSKKRRLTYSENDNSDKGRQQKKRKSPLHVTEASKSRDRGSHKVLREIQKSNKLLLTLVERVNKTEKRLKVVEGTLSNRSLGSSSSEVDSTPSRTPRRSHTKHDVPHAEGMFFSLYSHAHCVCVNYLPDRHALVVVIHTAVGYLLLCIYSEKQGGCMLY